jgi:hypothetical protein
VLIVAHERPRDAVQGEQLGGDAGVLAGDYVGSRQHLERAQRDVGGVADRRRDEIEAGAGEFPSSRRRWFTRFGRLANFRR